MSRAPRPSETQVVSTYGFNVPCRRFLLTTNITRDRRLSIVDEFVLRTLRVTGRLPFARLGAFFGFTPAETAAVLQDLADKKLVNLAGADVDLGPAAQETFHLGGDGVPRIVQVETWDDRIWFDLVSRNMMAPDRSRPLDYLISLKPNYDTKALSATFAREAFEQNFTRFLRQVRNINNPEAVALYSVSGIEAERFGMVVSAGTVELQLEPEPRLLPRLLKIQRDEFAQYRPLQDAMQDAVVRLSTPEPSQAGVADLRRLAGDRTVSSFMGAGKAFPLSAWFAESSLRANPQRVPIFGASYIERNSAALMRLMDRSGLPRLKRRPRPLTLYWYRPIGNAWGASPDLQRVVSEIVGQVKLALSPDTEVTTCVVTPQAARGETAKRFRRVFDRCLVAPTGLLAGGTEVLYLEGVAAIILTSVWISPHVKVPVGFVLSDSADLQRLDQGLRVSEPGETAVVWDATRRSAGDLRAAPAPNAWRPRTERGRGRGREQASTKPRRPR